MVRADQGIQGRSAPRSKNRSSVTASIRARTSTSTPDVPAAPPHQITKAAKRALKRAELMSKVNPTSRTSLLNLEPTTGAALSKSSLRRQKKKQREQLAGNTTGLKDLAEAMDEVAQQVQENEEDLDDRYASEDADDDDKMSTEALRQQQRTSSAYPLVGAQKTRKDATVTEKARKEAL